MCMVQVTQGPPPRPVHDGWKAQVLPGVGDTALRDAIWGSARFADRLVAGLMGRAIGPVVPMMDHAVVPTLAVLMDHLDDAFLRKLGLMWFAPMLAVSVLDAGKRSAYGLSARDDVQVVLRYRAHCHAAVVGNVPDSPDYLREGAHCVVAWLAGCADQGTAQRLRLTLPADEAESAANPVARSALVALVLADQMAGGKP
jgi:hypothetical protein